MGSRRSAGHLAALFTIIIWGTTFISTKVLLTDFRPVEILCFRFVMGFVALFLFDFRIGLERFADMTCLFNILYLGLGASALCFVTWNFAVKALGAVSTSVYIYMVPVITVATSVLILKEPVTWGSGLGTVMAVAGLFLSEYSGKEKRKNK